MNATLLIEHLEQLYAVAGPAPRAGGRQGDDRFVADGAIACEGERILAVGTTAAVRAAVTVSPATEVMDGRGNSLVPGFVDGHTHVVFAGDRRDELRRRLGGATYAEIAADGGGILSTVRATREASEDDLAAATRGRLAEMLAAGTTTAEAKSGYGLDTGTELRMLRVIATLNAEQPVELAATLWAPTRCRPNTAAGRPTTFDSSSTR